MCCLDSHPRKLDAPCSAGLLSTLSAYGESALCRCTYITRYVLTATLSSPCLSSPPVVWTDGQGLAKMLRFWRLDPRHCPPNPTSERRLYIPCKRYWRPPRPRFSAYVSTGHDFQSISHHSCASRLFAITTLFNAIVEFYVQLFFVYRVWTCEPQLTRSDPVLIHCHYSEQWE